MGGSIDVSLTVSPIKDASGQIIGASKILRDVSNRKRLEQSLLQAEKIAATGRMAATIAHEVNNPLEAVMNLLFLLRPRSPTRTASTILPQPRMNSDGLPISLSRPLAITGSTLRQARLLLHRSRNMPS